MKLLILTLILASTAANASKDAECEWAEQVNRSHSNFIAVRRRDIAIIQKSVDQRTGMLREALSDLLSKELYITKELIAKLERFYPTADLTAFLNTIKVVRNDWMEDADGVLKDYLNNESLVSGMLAKLKRLPSEGVLAEMQVEGLQVSTIEKTINGERAKINELEAANVASYNTMVEWNPNVRCGGAPPKVYHPGGGTSWPNR